MTGKRRTILIVEDDKDVRTVLDALLINGDTRIALAPDVTTALAVIEATIVDVIVTDHAMPDRTGMDLVLEVGRRIPCVVWSAWITENLRAAYLAAGAVAVLEKPGNFSEIRTIVRKAAGLR